jgi:hypothetical protein
MNAAIDEHTKRLYAAAYVAGERLIEAHATWERLYNQWVTATDDGDEAAYSAAERDMQEAMAVLGSVLTAARQPPYSMRLVWGAAGLMELTLTGDASTMAVWVEEPIDLRPPRRERPLWRSTAVAGGTA